MNSTGTPRGTLRAARATIGDRLAYKLIRGLAFEKPKLIGFETLFPQWGKPKQQEKNPIEIARSNQRRLDEWCDKFED